MEKLTIFKHFSNLAIKIKPTRFQLHVLNTRDIIRQSKQTNTKFKTRSKSDKLQNVPFITTVDADIAVNFCSSNMESDFATDNQSTRQTDK